MPEGPQTCPRVDKWSQKAGFAESYISVDGSSFPHIGVFLK